MEPQVALTMPLLEGTDGHKKMSKSYGNYVGLTDEPADMYGKIMSIPDELLGRYYRLASTFPVEKVDAIDASLADGTADPYALKRQLAANIVELYHGAQAASDAAAAFDALFKEHQRPHAPEVACELIVNDEGKVYLPALLAQVGLAKSAGEGRRLIDGGGVRLNDEPLAPKTYNLDPSQVEGAFIQVGKRRAVQLV